MMISLYLHIQSLKKLNENLKSVACVFLKLQAPENM